MKHWANFVCQSVLVVSYVAVTFIVAAGVFSFQEFSHWVFRQILGNKPLPILTVAVSDCIRDHNPFLVGLGFAGLLALGNLLTEYGFRDGKPVDLHIVIASAVLNISLALIFVSIVVLLMLLPISIDY